VFKGFYLIAQTKNQIAGILPLIHVKLPFLPGNLVSLPYCDAGGPLADTPEIERELILKALTISKHLKVKNVSIRSTDNIAGIKPELTLNKEKVRMILQLPANSEILLSSLKAKVRSQVNKPVKDGLSSHIGGPELLDAFYPLFAENMRDLGSPVHTKKWLESILKAFKNRAHLVVVKMPDKKLAAGGIILTGTRQVSVPWASSLRKYNRWNPNMLLYWTFLKFSCDMKYDLFYFGRSTIGEGTFQFKKQWGAKSTPLYWMDILIQGPNGLEPAPDKQAGSGRNRELAASVIMKMPVCVSRALGNMTRKYISL